MQDFFIKTLDKSKENMYNKYRNNFQIYLTGVIILYRAITAGFLISVASMIYANCTNHIVGAILFSIGLICIIRSEGVLYTTCVGNCRLKLSDVTTILFILVGNIVGCLFSFIFPNKSYYIMMDKLSKNLWEVVAGAVLCGILVYIAVLLDFKGSNMWATVMCVTAFILGGGEHSIADICYLINARMFTFKAFQFIFIVLIGNAIGAKICMTLLSCAGDEWREEQYAKKLHKKESNN